MDRGDGGHTLIELLACLAVLFVVAGLAAPGLHGMIEKHSVETAAQDLTRSISMARSLAVDTGSLVTFCRSAGGTACGGGWEQGGILFTDRNGDRAINGADALAWRMRAPGSVGIRFRAFPNRQYLQFTPLGFTRDQNGSFTICPAGGDVRLAQQVVISRSGRTRRAVDSDGDGIREASDGDPLECP